METNLKSFIKDVATPGLTEEEYELFVKMMDHEFDSKEERLWYIEMGYEDEDLLEDLNQAKKDAAGFKNKNIVSKES